MESPQHVRSLTYSEFYPLDIFHGDYFEPPLHRLQHITFDDVIFAQPDPTNSLPASQNTISSLYLCRVDIFSVTIVNLINFFPNLKELHIHQCTILGHRTVPIPPFSRSPSGKLHLTKVGKMDMALLSSCFSEVELAYDELEIVDCGQAYSDVLPIVYACGKALARLKLSPPSSLYGLTLKSFSTLQELVLSAQQMGPQQIYVSLIGSIASTNMQKIVLALQFEGSGWNPVYWSSLDTGLSSLVDRLRASGYEHTLELQFQLDPKIAEAHLKLDQDTFFPRFRKKGRVTLLDPTSGRTFYRSDDDLIERISQDLERASIFRL